MLFDVTQSCTDILIGGIVGIHLSSNKCKGNDEFCGEFGRVYFATGLAFSSDIWRSPPAVPAGESQIKKDFSFGS